MLSVSNLSVQYGKRVLFDQVNVSFTPGNCYGIIGANGAGKSTFLKIISGKQEANSGNVFLEPGKRLSVLEEDFSEQDGEQVGLLQVKFEEMNGWNADSEAASLLSNLEIPEALHFTKMSELDGKQKVRVLLAQALFGNPDVLIMDEPTNDLDYDTIMWLEQFLANYENTVIVVSHDRHFLDSVCTHISDIDFGKINHYTGNYSFWYESSQLATKQRAQQNKKSEEKKKELEEFIARFSANVAKSKQATSRKKMIDKLDIEEIKPSSRRYPAIIFEQEREAGDQILNVENLSSSLNNELLFNNVDLNLAKGDKVIVYAKDSRAITAFYDILMGRIKQKKGSFSWGITTNQAYLPVDHDYFFDTSISLVEWLRQYSKTEEEREKVRCMLSKMMMERANVLLLNEPTNHLDLESITAFNNSLKNFKGTLLCSTSDHTFSQSLGTRIVELTPKGSIDRHMTFDEYMTDPKIKELRFKMHSI